MATGFAFRWANGGSVTCVVCVSRFPDKSDSRSLERGPVVELDRGREGLYLGQWVFASSPSKEELLEMPKNCGTACDKCWSGVKAFRTSTYTGMIQVLKCTMPSRIRRLCFYVEIVGGGISEMQHAL